MRKERVVLVYDLWRFFFFFQAEDGIRDVAVTGVQTCALPIWGQALRQRFTLAHEAVARMRHLGAEPAAAHFAEGTHAQAFFGRTLELLQLAAIEIEKAQVHAIGVHGQLAARPAGYFGPLELRLDRHNP